MNIEEVKFKISNISDIIMENKDYLTDLDRAIGDADHGYNMNKGFKEVKNILDDEYNTLKDLFNKIAMILISNVGGASGPLYGSFFMKFAQSLDNEKELDRDLFAKAFSQGLDAVKMRGKAKPGDKTMVDVLESVSNAIEDGKDYKKIVEISKKAMEDTKDLKARKGRAAYLGERSIGHIDPGACSSYLMIKKALEE